MRRALPHPSLLVGLALMAGVWAGGVAALGEWSVHPSIPLGVGALLALYALGIGPLREARELGPPVEWEQWLAFVSGALAIFVALTGPVHDLSDSYLFSAHMIQHLMITLLAPPLLLIGTPGWLVRWLVRPAPVLRAARFLGHPTTAFIAWNGTLLAWHLPVLYNATLVDLDVHIFEHLLFIATALMAWWPTLAPARELRAPMVFQLIYLLVLPIPMKILGMMLTFSTYVLYPEYAIAPRIWGISASIDQQIGGIIMWVPAGFVIWINLAAHFFRWYRESARQDRHETNVVPLTRERVT
ncbi:MAG TPA: cytochrome c oxidase assembly protein [Myxococcota bacterium]|nr:cytochrome c oxidase assembly protein [Myxococcota bacterium]